MANFIFPPPPLDLLEALLCDNFLFAYSTTFCPRGHLSFSWRNLTQMIQRLLTRLLVAAAAAGKDQLDQTTTCTHFLQKLQVQVLPSA